MGDKGDAAIDEVVRHGDAYIVHESHDSDPSRALLSTEEDHNVVCLRQSNDFRSAWVDDNDESFTGGETRDFRNDTGHGHQLARNVLYHMSGHFYDYIIDEVIIGKPVIDGNVNVGAAINISKLPGIKKDIRSMIRTRLKLAKD